MTVANESHIFKAEPSCSGAQKGLIGINDISVEIQFPSAASDFIRDDRRPSRFKSKGALGDAPRDNGWECSAYGSERRWDGGQFFDNADSKLFDESGAFAAVLYLDRNGNLLYPSNIVQGKIYTSNGHERAVAFYNRISLYDRHNGEDRREDGNGVFEARNIPRAFPRTGGFLFGGIFFLLGLVSRRRWLSLFLLYVLSPITIVSGLWITSGWSP